MVLHQIANSYGNYNYNAYVYTDISWDSHFHSNYELIYTIEGVTEIIINGVKDTLSVGELILLSPYTIHSLTISQNAKTWIGVFSEDFIVSFAEKNRYIRYSKFRCSKETEVILKNYLFYQGQPERYIIMSCLYMVCNECTKNATSHNIKQSDKFIHRVTDYISENLSENITLKEISKELNYEYHYFSSLFHQCFHMNFKSFINIFRFENACKLLADKTTDITTVCIKCGFSSIRNFNRVFKQLSGITPSEYRRIVEKQK